MIEKSSRLSGFYCYQYVFVACRVALRAVKEGHHVYAGGGSGNIETVYSYKRTGCIAKKCSKFNILPKHREKWTPCKLYATLSWSIDINAELCFQRIMATPHEFVGRSQGRFWSDARGKQPFILFVDGEGEKVWGLRGHPCLGVWSRGGKRFFCT